jgi:hypothetical protein
VSVFVVCLSAVSVFVNTLLLYVSVSVCLCRLSVHVSACTVHRKWWRYWFMNTLLLCVSVCVCMCLLTSVCPCQCLHGTSKVVAVLVRDKHADGPFSYGYGRCPVLIEYAGAALLALVTCSFLLFYYLIKFVFSIYMYLKPFSHWSLAHFLFIF